MGWSLISKPCDSCQTTPSAVFCRADSAFLCVACDANIHAANKLASRHARVPLCQACEQSPAVVTCKADAAALCAACDADIHSANPLALRHQRLPVLPIGGHEAEAAASWLLPNENVKLEADLFADADSFLDLDLISVDEQKQYYSPDGVVPVQTGNQSTSQSMSQSVSSSSLDVGVSDHSTAVSEVTNNAVAITGIEREARVMRYREKRKSRRFEKTIRYASRKAYAETRPRIKGRFAKRTTELDVDSFFAYNDDVLFSVVPTL